jgi:hypothetical protein
VLELHSDRCTHNVALGRFHPKNRAHFSGFKSLHCHAMWFE